MGRIHHQQRTQARCPIGRSHHPLVLLQCHSPHITFFSQHQLGRGVPPPHIEDQMVQQIVLPMPSGHALRSAASIRLMLPPQRPQG
ncbi:MAG: hypothetical protein Q8L00_02565 [Deltaproteobacteria bacterium]|nr:hypothetical protein [Deltaproteobacteria bacterium]